MTELLQLHRVNVEPAAEVPEDESIESEDVDGDVENNLE